MSTDFGRTGRRRPPNSTWTTEREQYLLRLWDRNSSIKTIAAKLNLSDGAIRAKLERLGKMYVKKTGLTPLEIYIDELKVRKGIK